jgi:hypothetical protein
MSLRDFGVQLCVHHRKTTSSSLFRLLPALSDTVSTHHVDRLHHVLNLGRVKGAHMPQQSELPACTDVSLGAHRPHHRCLPCRYSLRLPPLDSIPWLLSQRAEAYPHSVSLPHITCSSQQRTASRTHLLITTTSRETLVNRQNISPILTGTENVSPGVEDGSLGNELD